ncbi:MAG: response regulator [Elusimicrobiota bacterium]
MPYKIMIVDDEKDIVFVLKIALEKEGFATDEAYDGIQALEKIGMSKPDLILLDIMMSKLDGHGVNLRLKEDPETAKIPVIVITGKGHLKELLQARDELQVAAYMEKPFTVKALIEKIREILK